MSKNKPNVVVIVETTDDDVDQKFHVFYNNYAYCILPMSIPEPINLYFEHNVNVIDDEMLLNFTFYNRNPTFTSKSFNYSADVISVLFDTKTLNAETYKVRVNAEFSNFDYGTYLLNGKLYLVIRCHYRSYRKKFTALVKIPDMLIFITDDIYDVFDMPRFLLMFHPETDRCLIFDSDDESMWFHSFNDMERFIEFRDDVIRVLEKSGAICGAQYSKLVDTDEQFVVDFITNELSSPEFKYCDYDILRKSRKFKEFINVILLSKANYGLEWCTVDCVNRRQKDFKLSLNRINAKNNGQG